VDEEEREEREASESSVVETTSVDEAGSVAADETGEEKSVQVESGERGEGQ
jgi:hypothetical protein